MNEDIRDGHGAASGAATEAPDDMPAVAGGVAPAVNEDPVRGSTRGTDVAVFPAPAEPSAPPTAEDVRRFRRAALRARLALLGVAFDPATGEATLRRMLRAAEGQGGGAEAPPVLPVFPVPADTANPATRDGQAEQAALAAPPSVEMRRAMARHLRERQRAAAEDAGPNAGRSRGRGRS